MKAIEREYNLTNAELCMLASNFVVFMNRDEAEFDARGVDDTVITAFEALGNAFEVFPTDDEYIGLITIEVDAKNAMRDTIMDSIQSVSGYLQQKWGLASGQYRRLGIKGVERLSDDLFLVKAREVVRIAEEYLADLTPVGLTQAMIDDLETDAQSFEDKLNAVKDAKALRDSKTQERTDKGNELYSFVKQYSTIGKLIWENLDEAKYNDYIIYKTEGGLPGKVLNLGYDAGTSMFSWDVPLSPEPIDKYELERSTDGDNWTQVYQGAENEALVPLLAGENYFRCRAHNKNGWGTWSDILDVNVGGIPAPDWVNAVYSGVPPGAKVTPEQVEVTWANVAEANMYEVWRSVVNVGDPAGDFTKIANEASEMYLDFDLTKNKRNYYYIIAKNETERSEPSDVAWDDIVD